MWDVGITTPAPRVAGSALALALMSFAYPPTPCHADEGDEAVSLEEMIESTRIHNVSLRLAATEVEIANANVMAAAEPFDSALGASATASQSYQFGVPGASRSALTLQQLSGTATWSRRFRNGLVVTPEATATASRIFDRPVVDATSMSARLKLAAPLVRDRGGAITAAPERAALVDRDASWKEARQTDAQILVQAAQSYWEYLAAERRLQVMAASEQRSARDVAVTGALVKADERTGSDLIQAQGYHSSRKAARIAAEQQRLEAARRLAIVMGARWQSGATVVRAVTDFPSPPATTYAETGLRWITAALSRRADRAAADLRVRAAEVRLDAARNELTQRLDVEVSAGYTGQSQGLGSFADLHRSLPGAEAALTLTYQLPIEQSGVRGKAAQRAAVLAQLRIARLDVERQIPIGVLAGVESVRNSQLGLRESADAVRFLEQTVENEKRKFQLGSSTLFSVNQAEESLTGALLDKIDRQRDYAVALANLRFETGTLASTPRPGAARDSSADIVSRLTTLPD
jgi:outer membrane protein TolC